MRVSIRHRMGSIGKQASRLMRLLLNEAGHVAARHTDLANCYLKHFFSNMIRILIVPKHRMSQNVFYR